VRRHDRRLERIEDVYRTRYAQFVRLAIAITRDEEVACDAVHEAFVRAVRYRRRLRHDASAPGWICRIVLNEARKRRTIESRYVATDPEKLGPGLAANGRTERGDLEAAVAALPERQRLVVFLRHYADLEYADIAEALDVAVGTVSATLHAAHVTLQARLREAERCET
jgi:RNA polymerase sigma-70 factor, ECF subfamily